MHLPADLLVPIDDRAVELAAEDEGVAASPLSLYFIGAPRRRGLLLGYAGVPEREIAPGVEKLALAIERAVAAARRPRARTPSRAR